MTWRGNVNSLSHEAYAQASDCECLQQTLPWSSFRLKPLCVTTYGKKILCNTTPACPALKDHGLPLNKPLTNKLYRHRKQLKIDLLIPLPDKRGKRIAQSVNQGKIKLKFIHTEFTSFGGAAAEYTACSASLAAFTNSGDRFIRT